MRVVYAAVVYGGCTIEVDHVRASQISENRLRAVQHTGEQRAAGHTLYRLPYGSCTASRAAFCCAGVQLQVTRSMGQKGDACGKACIVKKGKIPLFLFFLVKHVFLGNKHACVAFISEA